MRTVLIVVALLMVIAIIATLTYVYTSDRCTAGPISGLLVIIAVICIPCIGIAHRFCDVTAPLILRWPRLRRKQT